MSHSTCLQAVGSGQLECLKFNPLSTSFSSSSSLSSSASSPSSFSTSLSSIEKSGSCSGIGNLHGHGVAGRRAALRRGRATSWSAPCPAPCRTRGWNTGAQQRAPPLRLRSRGLDAAFLGEQQRGLAIYPSLWFGQSLMGARSRGPLLPVACRGGGGGVGRALVGWVVMGEASSFGAGKEVEAKEWRVGERGWSVIRRRKGGDVRAQAYDADRVVASVAAQKMGEDPIETAKRLQVSRRVARAAELFKRLGVIGFWSQLVCTFVSAGILAFSLVLTGKATSVVTLYLTAAGICGAFLSVFWSFGYTRLALRLREGVGNPSKAPPRSQVVRNLTNGLMINLFGMGAAILGMEATVGFLVGKALTSSAAPILQANPSYSPVLALDVFLVQASTNTVLSHFIGMILTLMLLRSVTLSQPPPDMVIPRPT